MAANNLLQIQNFKPFNGTGFSNWEFRLKLLLEQHGIEKVLEQEETSEGADETFRKNDAKARNIIVQWLSDEILEVVKDKTTAKKMYDTLKSTYVKKGLSIQVELQRKLRNMKYTTGSISNFIAEFERNVSDLKNSGGKVNEGEIISQLLCAMPQSFQSVTTTIDILYAQDPSKITLEFVKSKLLQEKSRQENNNKETSQTSDSVAFTSKRSYTSRRGRGSFNQNNLPARNETSEFKYKCYKCGKLGHKRSECRSNGRNSDRANIAEEEEAIIAN